MSDQNRIQLNVRIAKETADMLEEIVEYYQENTKLGRIYKGDVLTDIIEKSHGLMEKQKAIQKRKY
ncbi:hypothetical protein D3H55_01835 [Bacillus salacetis]|uniref:Uncharacterized protein n=1 Tax=Bacillus salacetis TaxID=2315464 RepID=A0A3A1R534_9BACI|nr:hypothetical protein [Bacillus salacetis]RIW38306.1 hypothetical protein D3H55_01835 [Bacillus salacetis]